MNATACPSTFDTGPLHADAYDRMRHEPHLKAVQDSYALLATAIAAQWNGLRAAGFRFTAWDDDPYPNSRAMLDDAENRRLVVFADGGASLPADHPMQSAPTAWGALGAEAEGFRTMNDVFRGVHDVMGHHAAHSAGHKASFGPEGEYNAWRAHGRSLPAGAYLALWCETRGQNAWTNFHADHATRPVKDRPYVDQRAGIPVLPLVTTRTIVTPPWIML